MSRSQDYIAKIRYQNDLPPPLLPPKLLNYSTNENEKIGSSSLLTSLYRKENINNLIAIDNDLGSPIDLVSVPYIFEIAAENKPFEDRKDSKLHEDDRFLLRDPGIDSAVKAEPNVAFLRRTEYIGSTKINSGSGSRSGTPQLQSKKANDRRTIDTPASQLRSIESGFEKATKSLKDYSTIKHPLKKNLKAKKVWSLLPDVSRMDQTFSTIRFASNRNKNQELLKTAILRGFKLNESTKWGSFYLSESEEQSNEIKKNLQDLNESLPIKEDESADKRFKYTKEGDYNILLNDLENSDEGQVGIREIALRFNDVDGIVYYNPISAKGELKKRKLQESLKEFYDDVDLDELDVKFREPTVDELNQRNNKRHKFDDLTYESTEIDRDEDEDDLEMIRKQNSEL